MGFPRFGAAPLLRPTFHKQYTEQETARVPEEKLCQPELQGLMRHVKPAPPDETKGAALLS